MPAVSYRPRYRVEDYLDWEGDWELWDGTPVSMSPSPGYFHQSAGSRLFVQLVRLLQSETCEQRCEALYEIDWHVDDHTVVRPDLLIVCERPEGRWIERRPDLVAEILSPSTREKDLVAKRALYAANGVPHYLVVDPDARSVQRLQLADDAYLERPADEPFELHPGCVLALEVPALFA